MYVCMSIRRNFVERIVISRFGFCYKRVIHTVYYSIWFVVVVDVDVFVLFLVCFVNKIHMQNHAILFQFLLLSQKWFAQINEWIVHSIFICIAILFDRPRRIKNIRICSFSVLIVQIKQNLKQMFERPQYCPCLHASVMRFFFLIQILIGISPIPIIQ